MLRPELVKIAMVTSAQNVFSEFGSFVGTLTSTEFARRAQKNGIGDRFQGTKFSRRSLPLPYSVGTWIHVNIPTYMNIIYNCMYSMVVLAIIL
jgi:hypothetical protein